MIRYTSLIYAKDAKNLTALTYVTEKSYIITTWKPEKPMIIVTCMFESDINNFFFLLICNMSISVIGDLQGFVMN